MKLNMTELDTKETKPKMSNYLKQKYIVLNEFSEKNIDDLYLKIRTEHGNPSCSLSFGELEYIKGNSQQHNKNKIIQFVKENPSNYVWKSLENNEYLVKDYYRVKKLEVLLSSFMYNEINNKRIYYLELCYLENKVKTDKILSTMIDNYDENKLIVTLVNKQEETISKINTYMEENIIIQQIQDKMLQIEQEFKRLSNQLYTIQYIILIVMIYILF